MVLKNINKAAPSNRRITGQGMTEYIIIVALIAISAITVVGLFGDVVKSQFGAMAVTLGGGAATTDAAGVGDAAAGEGSKAGTLNNFGGQGAGPGG